MSNICVPTKLLYTKCSFHICESEKQFKLGLFYVRMNLKAVNAKSCENNSIFYNYEDSLDKFLGTSRKLSSNRDSSTRTCAKDKAVAANSGPGGEASSGE